MYCKRCFAGLGKRQPLVRQVAAAVCAVFIVGSLLSTAFIFAHAHHEHDHRGEGGGCATCAQLETAIENQLKNLFTVMTDAAPGFAGAIAALPIQKPSDRRMTPVTPVRLKVRLNH